MPPRKNRIRFWELGGVVLLVAVAGMLALTAVRLVQERATLQTCQDQLRQWHQAIRLFASEHAGRYPGRFIDYQKAYRPESSFWGEIDYQELCPKYLVQPGIAFCPAMLLPPAGWNDPSMGYGYPEISGYRRGIEPSWADDPLDSPVRELAREMRDQGIAQAQADKWCRDNNPENDRFCYWRMLTGSYNYWGWAVRAEQVANADDMYEMGRIIDNDLDEPSTLNPGCNVSRRFQDLEVTLPKFGKTDIRYFREGVERFAITDLQNPAIASQARARQALMWDRTEPNPDVTAANTKVWPHPTMAANVLFMDGHVELTAYPQLENGPFWMLTESAMFDKMVWWP